MLHAELQAEEEFQEADILWTDAADFQESPRFYLSQIGIDDDDSSGSREHQAPLKLQVRQKASSPIDMPGRKVVVCATAARGTDRAPAGSSKFSASHAGGGVGAGSTVTGSHVFMPPHVIVDRRAKRDKAVKMLVVPTGRARARKMLE